MTHFNRLTPAEAERLAWLLEELGEAAQAVGKILRHGYESRNPLTGDPTTNRMSLEREAADVAAAIDLLVSSGDLGVVAVNVRREAKAHGVMRWMHHQVVPVPPPAGGERKEEQMHEKDHGGTRLTEVDAVSVSVHADQLPHAAQLERVEDRIPDHDRQAWGDKKYEDARAFCYGLAGEVAEPFLSLQMSPLTQRERMIIDRIAEWMGSRDCQISQLHADVRFFLDHWQPKRTPVDAENYLDALWKIESLVKSDAAHIYGEVKQIIHSLAAPKETTEVSSPTAASSALKENSQSSPLPLPPEVT